MGYNEILKQFNIEAKDFSYYNDAFTHSSFSNEHHHSVHDYERIEFVGDGVLDLIVADLIYNRYPTMNQGSMTKLRSNLVCSKSLASYSKKYHLDTAIRLGKGEGATGPNQKILEDVFEAFIGAIYLDQGFFKVKEVIEFIFKEAIENYQEDTLTDYKSKLQEYLQSSLRGSVVYKVVEEKGNAQNKTFVVEAIMKLDEGESLKLGRGEGTNKKKAEQAAAKNALEKKAGE